MKPLMRAPVYNSRNYEMCLSSCVRRTWCLLILFTPACFASDWRQPEAQLASKIAAVTGPGVIALEVNNRSSIPSAEVEEIRRGTVSALSSSAYGSGRRSSRPQP